MINHLPHRAWYQFNNAGMGNNHTFHVKFHVHSDGYLQFDHPAQPEHVPGRI
jgi:hypothetical protein